MEDESEQLHRHLSIEKTWLRQPTALQELEYYLHKVNKQSHHHQDKGKRLKVNKSRYL